MRRFLLVLSVIAVLLGLTTPAAAAGAAAGAAGCVPAAAATYRHSFDGAAGTATITANRPLCAGPAQTFSLVSYTTGAYGSAAGQFIYETARDTITAADRSVTLKVAVPSCYTQVEAIFGSSYQTESTTTAALNGSAELGVPGSRSQGPQAWYSGGSTACTARPAATVTNACDGTFTVLLSNSGGTPAVFLTGSRRIRVHSGATTTLTPARGSTVTVRDSSFTTYVLSWRAPAQGCAGAPAASPTAPVPPSPTATATGSAGPATTSAGASPAPTTSSSAYESPAPLFSTSPPGPATAFSPTGSTGGMGTSSIIAIILGLLMIGTGAAAVTWLIRTNRRLA
ncbi:hypothetical protein [Paractinoplanes ferrugineus]|uniref:hypothetical protein n=1 Tax=Paractinoplanes ferrugineus TaxID=113564 RepID=UPI0019426734|nr:hypothetical protein [Actinoplanes ferrugineus]